MSAVRASGGASALKGSGWIILSAMRASCSLFATAMTQPPGGCISFACRRISSRDPEKSGRDPRWKYRRRTAAGRKADHRFRLAKGGVVGGDDEVGALGELGAAAVSDSVDGGEDWFSQLAHRVERAIEVLTLAQPVLFRHILALTQVAPDGEGSLTSSGKDDDAEGRADRDHLDDLGQARPHLGRDRIVGVWSVEGDDHHTLAGEEFNEHRMVGLRKVGRRRAEVECLPAVGSGEARGHVIPPLLDRGWSRLELRQPAESSQARRAAVLAAAGDDECRQVPQPTADRLLRNGEASRSIIRPGEWVLVDRDADENAVVQPLRLHELELALEVRTSENEDDAPVDAVLLQHSLGQHRAVACAPPDHAVEANVDAPVVVERISRVRASRVRACRAFEAA